MVGSTLHNPCFSSCPHHSTTATEATPLHRTKIHHLEPTPLAVGDDCCGTNWADSPAHRADRAAIAMSKLRTFIPLSASGPVRKGHCALCCAPSSQPTGRCQLCRSFVTLSHCPFHCPPPLSNLVSGSSHPLKLSRSLARIDASLTQSFSLSHSLNSTHTNSLITKACTVSFL